jgi:thiol-disulfide isomerase/thioredoxin
MGRTAPGFSLPNMEADTVSLSSFKGDYVLLDFWASWCVPCRKENPYLQYLQKKYRNRNFSIVSIAVGDSPVAWQEAIKKDNMTWTNLFEDPSQPISREQYGVMEIPASFLIDPEGNIIGRDLKGEELEKKLIDGLKKRQSASGLKALQN